jgi:hypothetical protein
VGMGSVKNSSDGFGFWGVGEGRFLDVGEGNFLGTSRLKDECLRQENRMNQLFKGDIKAKLERYKQISLGTKNPKPKIAFSGSARVVPHGPEQKLDAR